MKIGMMSAWNQNSGVSIHAELIGRECQVMGISRSTYYYRAKSLLETKKGEANLRDRIGEIVVEYPRYGYRRVTQ